MIALPAHEHDDGLDREQTGGRWLGLINDKTGLLTGKGLVLAVLAMFAFMAINLAGVKWMAEGNSIAMIWKIGVPVLTIIFIIAHSFHSSNFTAGGGFMPFGIKGVFIALPLGVIFAWKASSRPPSSPARPATPGGTSR